MSSKGIEIGLYLHVPYCHKLCTYCDFAKTANYDGEVAERYLTSLAAELKRWQECLSAVWPEWRYASVFFGGGTPGLFTRELARVFQVFQSHLSEHCEISLEANPENVDPQRLADWRSLGFNRLSLGVQTFSPRGLQVLGREHPPPQQTIDQALAVFPNTNIDLIYGWPEQTLKDWRQDIRIAKAVPHISAYCLTFESRTPLGRQKIRGKVAAQDDGALAEMYETARSEWGETHLHEEVSNWAIPGKSCQHNWIYWNGAPYLGVGSGAHSFLPFGPIGTRFAYPASDRVFMGAVTPDNAKPALLFGGQHFAVDLDTARSSESWLMEYVAGRLRTHAGLDLEKITVGVGRRLQHTAQLRRGLELGIVVQTVDSLRLNPGEWFRENAWAGVILDSLKQA
jgi:oxygen-independent coproporphyrinogen III oxidase